MTAVYKDRQHRWWAYDQGLDRDGARYAIRIALEARDLILPGTEIRVISQGDNTFCTGELYRPRMPAGASRRLQRGDHVICNNPVGSRSIMGNIVRVSEVREDFYMNRERTAYDVDRVYVEGVSTRGWDAWNMRSDHLILTEQPLTPDPDEEPDDWGIDDEFDE